MDGEKWQSVPETFDSRRPIPITPSNMLSEVNLTSRKRLSPALKRFEKCITMFWCDPTLHSWHHDTTNRYPYGISNPPCSPCPRRIFKKDYSTNYPCGSYAKFQFDICETDRDMSRQTDRETLLYNTEDKVYTNSNPTNHLFGPASPPAKFQLHVKLTEIGSTDKQIWEGLCVHSPSSCPAPARTPACDRWPPTPCPATGSGRGQAWPTAAPWFAGSVSALPCGPGWNWTGSQTLHHSAAVCTSLVLLGRSGVLLVIFMLKWHVHVVKKSCVEDRENCKKWQLNIYCLRSM